MSISIVVPSMRPDTLPLVLNDLCSQTLKPKTVIVIDNGCNINHFDVHHMINGIQLICLGKNVGTNQVWNRIFDFETEYVGFVADDLRLDLNMLEIQVKALDMRFQDKYKNWFYPGIVSAVITKRWPLPPTDVDTITGFPVNSKGNCGAVLMKKCVANCIPKIPEDFFIFFGDNWFSYWLNPTGMSFIQVSTCVHHIPGETDLSEKMNYYKVLKSERGHWKEFLRGKKEYSI